MPGEYRAMNCLCVLGEEIADPKRRRGLGTIVDVFRIGRGFPDANKLGNRVGFVWKNDGEAAWIGKEKRFEFVELDVRHKP